MAYKPFSQKAARFFEIVCYILLIPTFISIFLMVSEIGLLVLFPIAVIGIGLILLSGYRRHARGTFDKDKLSLLWFGTLIFNGIPLTPIFYQIIFSPGIFVRININDILYPPVLLFSLLVLWWIIAFTLSITLILDEFRRDTRIK